MDSDAWNDRYRTADLLWSATPNQFVERELADLLPGAALDLAAGEGRNAIWLAQGGWDVTAVEFSTVAVERGRAKMCELGVAVSWVVSDVLKYEQPLRSFQLVLVSYLQLPWSNMQVVFGRAAEALAPGGTLFIIGHDADNRERGYGGPSSPEVVYTPAQVVGALDGLETVRAETIERVVDTDGGPRTALDCLVRATRP
jgi:SAM-dependent methyltransferase